MCSIITTTQNNIIEYIFSDIYYCYNTEFIVSAKLELLSGIWTNQIFFTSKIQILKLFSKKNITH